MSIEIDPPQSSDDSLHPSLAVGTSDVAQDDRTKVESPAGRNKTPVPKEPNRPPRPPRNAGDPDNRIGSVLGAYKVHELLGKGGMGYVFRAEHVKLGREVALKLLRGDYAKRRDAVLRFFQEAKTVNRVRHRNIVDVTDFVELDDGTTFIIMEFLRGQSLGKWARTGIDLPRALAVLVQICDGLGAAHAVGVVHRDLKPDNVIVVPTSDGAELVKLLDFGVAKLVNRDDEDIGFQTAAGSVIGTPAYMSPEQAGGMVVDHRSDIYSLGAIMYELFCGQPMFRGRSFGEYVRKHLTEIPLAPRQTQNGAQIDERLEALILKCLTKDPNERFQNIIELRDGLLHLLGGIETQPPGSVVLSHSSVHSSLRPVSTGMAYGQLPPHMLPLPAPMVTTVPTPGPAGHASQPAIGHASIVYGPYGGVPAQTTTPPAPTPWWVWFAGAVVAVGLGVAGALWLAQKDDGTTAAPAVRQPTSAPIESGTKLVELRFDSLPSGGVYADGRSAELCRTPCNFNVDLGDGGPTDRRTFLVRADGYEDKSVVVDFAVSQRDFSVTLTRLATVPSPPTRTVADNTAETIDLTVSPAAGRPSAGKKYGKKSGSKRTESRKAEAKKAEAKVEEQAPEPVVPKPDVKKPDPVVPKPEDKKPIKKIDRTDTIDPFRKK